MIPERYLLSFHSKYRVSESGCWEWTKGRFDHGYGKFNKRANAFGLSSYAHRTSWIIHYGPIPEGLQVCHKCDNRGCVNPNHLFLGTPQENSTDASRKGRLYGWDRPRGEASGRHKLTQDQVDHIKSSSEPTKELAQFYGVSRSCISRVRRGAGWLNRTNRGPLTDEEKREIRQLDLPILTLSLKYGVSRETIRDLTGGKNLRGSHNPQAKLSEEDIRAIRGSSLSPGELSLLYKVSRASISNILNFKSWRHVE